MEDGKLADLSGPHRNTSCVVEISRVSALLGGRWRYTGMGITEAIIEFVPPNFISRAGRRGSQAEGGKECSCHER